MGNQTSRFDQSSSSTTITDDPCLDNMRQWHTNKNDEPYKRQYPLPTIANDHNRVKPRKQSSPAVSSLANSYSGRKPFSRFFNRQNSNKLLPRNNSYIDSTNTALNHYNTLTRTTTSNTIAAITSTKQPNITNNTNNNTTTSTNNSSTTSTNSLQPHYIHPLAPPSIDQRSCHQLFPYENESFSKASLETSSRRLTSSNRNSLNNSQLLILAQQQQQEQHQAFTYRLNGKRKYHQVAGSSYLLPCDDEEIDRLHLQHFMIRFAIQG
jgi:hypothetical protein